MNPEETDDWISRQVNKETLAEMENVIPMLTVERTALRRWVNKGNDPERNPWGYLDEDGWPLNFVEGYRRHKGDFFNVYYHIIEE